VNLDKYATLIFGTEGVYQNEQHVLKSEQYFIQAQPTPTKDGTGSHKRKRSVAEMGFWSVRSSVICRVYKN
jgi:hypothetical protein